MNGTRVLDFSRVLAGPWASQMLADQGADVVKVESPEGDETRAFAPIAQGVSTYFLSCNRNKRSIALDLRSAAGREVALALAARADVVLENFRPGVMERLGLGWKVLSAERRDLVYVAIHAFGDEVGEPWVRRPGYDLVLQAMGGSVSFTGFPGQPPIRAGLPSADLLTGLQAVQAVLLGLLHREKTGEGQKIVVNMLQVQLSALVYHATRHAVTGEAETPRGNAHRGLVPYDVYRCADGWLAVACGNDAIFSRLARALGLGSRPEWATNAGRVADRAGVDAAVGAALSTLPVGEADRRLAEAGVPAGPVLGVGEVRSHPAAHEVRVDHPVLGQVALPGPPIATASTRRQHAPPPDLGADRDEILAEAGFSSSDVLALADRGAFGAGRARPGA